MTVESLLLDRDSRLFLDFVHDNLNMIILEGFLLTKIQGKPIVFILDVNSETWTELANIRLEELAAKHYHASPQSQDKMKSG